MHQIWSNKTFKKAALVLFVLAFIGAIVLAVFVHYHSVLGLDVFLSRDLQAEGNTPERQSLLYRFLYFISLAGRPAISIILVVGSALCFWLLKYFREAFYCLLTPAAAGINFVIKIMVDRPRPSENLVQVLNRELDPSFPSGHVVFYVVFFGFIIAAMFFTPKIPRLLRLIIAVISLSMIILISFSRVYLGAHWMTDTLGGYLVGFVLLFILVYFYARPKL